MSLPLTRRIARAALLVAAGAAPVVGAAGSASAVDLPKAADLGGLTKVDPSSVTETAGNALENTSAVAGPVAGEVVKKAVPEAGRAGNKTLQKLAPTAKKTTGHVTGDTKDTVGDTTRALPAEGLTKDLPLAEELPAGQLLAGLPVTKGLPTDGLPVSGVLGGLGG
ncbi:ATP-binding protein [Streptomyces sp. Ru73]|uniref:ATP-binding protein n=1 Tax=Streptomyces sp. Ru73 TaxID=2080748 RepID=UPI000CDE48EF|nr:ATP-binding protein [Streptomyces sp. Ru73]POX40482.1 ATP-binding protein [Streptomyces sp. Ru73]